MKKTLRILKNLRKAEGKMGIYKFNDSIYSLDVIINEIKLNTKIGKKFVKELNAK